MGFKLLGRDMAVQITFGGAADGVANFGVGASYMAVARTVKVQESAETEDMSGLSDGAKAFRGKKGEYQVILEGTVFSEGFTSPKINGMHVNQYLKVEIKPEMSLTEYDEYTGIVNQWEWDSGDSAQVERISMQGPAVIIAGA
jgi:hypothetical protein